MDESTMFNIINWNHHFVAMEQIVAARKDKLRTLSAERKRK